MTGDLLGAAAGLDASLRAEARTIATSMVAFRDLITQAKQQQIHEALGFTSWPAYVADVIGSEMGVLAIDDRRQIVALLAGHGMSQRAIADAVRVSQKTVDRDLDQVSHDDSPAASAIAADAAEFGATVTGRDGKTYPAKRRRVHGRTLDERNAERAAQGLPPLQKARKLTPEEALIRKANDTAAWMNTLADRVEQLFALDACQGDMIGQVNQIPRPGLGPSGRREDGTGL